MKRSTDALAEAFFLEHPQLAFLRDRAADVVGVMTRENCTVYTCGNGGSAADSEHIVGELMKQFKIPRAADKQFKENFIKQNATEKAVLEKLQGAVRAVSLVSCTALSSAVANDIGADFVYAQQAYALCRPGDLLLCISTSGNAKNVLYAAMAARARGAKVAALTGESGGRLAGACDFLFNVPEKETYRVQELHMPLYHLLCAAVENELWGTES